MSKVRLNISLEIPLNESQREKLNIDSESLFLKGNIAIRAEVEKNSEIYYLGQSSIEDFDLLYALGKGNTLKFYNSQDQEINHDKFYRDMESFILQELNDDINCGNYDDQIKEKYKKDKDYRNVTAADLRDRRHRASPHNPPKKNHNWIPEKDKSGMTCPEFSIFDDRTKKKLGTFNSIISCCSQYSLNSGNVLQCLRKERELCEGYYFRFTNENSESVTLWLSEQDS